MALRKRGVTFLTGFRKRRVPRKEWVPSEEGGGSNPGGNYVAEFRKLQKSLLDIPLTYTKIRKNFSMKLSAISCNCLFVNNFLVLVNIHGIRT